MPEETPLPAPPSCAVADVLRLDDATGWLSPPLQRLAGSGDAVARPAFTVAVEAVAGGGGLGSLFELCDSGLLEDRTLVVAGATTVAGAVWGEILSVATRRAGAAAVVVDGAVRDVAAIPATAPGLWARSIATVGPGRDVRVASIGEPVTVADVLVAPGDIVVADVDGLVALPHGTAASVLRRARRYAAAEAEVVAAMHRGERAAVAYEAKKVVVDDLLRGSP